MARSRNEGLIRASRFMATGFEFAGSVIGGLILGYYADDYLGTSPLLTLFFTLGGMFGAVYRLLWSLRKQREERQRGH